MASEENKVAAETKEVQESTPEVKSETKEVSEQPAAPAPEPQPPKPIVRKSNFEKDIVYLYQFSRTPVVPSLSPYCLKVETWLRLAGLKYEVSVYFNFLNIWAVFVDAAIIVETGMLTGKPGFCVSHSIAVFNG